MTKEEIKDMYSMRDILARYGLYPNKAGMVRCPFHKGDREPSLKVYEKDFHCFGCGAHGDIFDFVCLMDNLTFREAFESLGGNYEHSARADFKVYHAQKKREMERKQEEEQKQQVELNNLLISVYRSWIQRLEPFSSAWCDCQNALTVEIAKLEERMGW
jgi:DNA primase